MLFELYISFFKVGILSFGGGLAALPMIQAQIVDAKGWLTLTEFTNLITIAQMTPGPIAINSATFVGTQLFGLVGAIVATLGCISPSIIIISFLSFIYNRYRDLSVVSAILQALRPAVVALILAAGVSIFTLVAIDENTINYIGLIIFILSFITIRFFKIPPIRTMIIYGGIGMFAYLWF